MRRLAICIGLTLSLAPAGAAVAKEPVKAKVCGASECRTVKDRDALMTLTEGGPPTDPPDRGAGWYSVRMTIAIDRGRHDQFSLAIVPGLGLLRGSDGTEGYAWMPATPTAVREYRRITRGLEPKPAGALRGVGRPHARVDEVVLPPAEAEAEADGGSSPLPWIAGGVVLLGLAGALIRWRGLPWPKPAQG
jgi:hypothetical protein